MKESVLSQLIDFNKSEVKSAQHTRVQRWKYPLTVSRCRSSLMARVKQVNEHFLPEKNDTFRAVGKKAKNQPPV